MGCGNAQVDRNNISEYTEGIPIDPAADHRTDDAFWFHPGPVRGPVLRAACCSRGMARATGRASGYRRIVQSLNYATIFCGHYSFDRMKISAAHLAFGFGFWIYSPNIRRAQ